MTAVASVLAHREVPVGSRAIPVGTTTAAPRVRRIGLLRKRAQATGTLASAPVGAKAVVEGIASDIEPAAARRLVDLGFAPGATVEVLRRAPMADPTIFRVADTEIALRRRHAQAILTTAAQHG